MKTVAREGGNLSAWRLNRTLALAGGRGSRFVGLVPRGNGPYRTESQSLAVQAYLSAPCRPMSHAWNKQIKSPPAAANVLIKVRLGGPDVGHTPWDGRGWGQ